MSTYDTLAAEPLAGSKQFPRLLSPLKAGAHMLRNRALMGSMHTRLDTMDRGMERVAEFYATRARGGAGLIATGGFAPNMEGRLESDGPVLCTQEQADELSIVARRVHEEGGKIILQILHAGRYAKVDELVGASSIPSRINRRVPRALSTADVWRTIEDYVRCSELAKSAGFDGVEIMGSEGYLLNQFTVTLTNDRTDEFGGSVEGRHKMPVEIVRRVRERLGPDFLIMYRVSVLDLIEGGAPPEEIDALARAVEAAGADLLNTGVGWHESTIPTVSYVVPRAAFSFATKRVRDAVSIPVIVSNRINTPGVAEELLSSGVADMVSMARPFLADENFMLKAAQGKSDRINTCIACNQACLDYIFTERPASCLVNPRAGRELDYADVKLQPKPKKVAVVGGGAAGLSCALTAAERGHDVTLFEASDKVGGQLNLAAAVPCKTEFYELLRYFRRSLEEGKVKLRLEHKATADELASGGFDHIVVATGIKPRDLNIPGIDHAKVISYPDLLSGRRRAGRRVAVIGAGGIGFDVSEFLLHEEVDGHSDDPVAHFHQEWGIDPTFAKGGGLKPERQLRPWREVTLMQRKPEKLGRTLGKSTGWALKSMLARRNVQMLSGCSYEKVDDSGLHITVNGQYKLLPVDSVIVCAGQESENELVRELEIRGTKAVVIGGAELAAELDALRAIDQGTRLALSF